MGDPKTDLEALRERMRLDPSSVTLGEIMDVGRSAHPDAGAHLLLGVTVGLLLGLGRSGDHIREAVDTLVEEHEGREPHELVEAADRALEAMPRRH